ncbi:hypothetical protein F6Y24_07880 [Xanthomonas arboricola pv. pruni]|nr:hypothetical protein F6Y24_07880 [Xanthomonas arboricola pv. pruni]
MGIGESGIGNRESGIGNRESGIGNRESGIGNRESSSGLRSCAVAVRVAWLVERGQRRDCWLTVPSPQPRSRRERGFISSPVGRRWRVSAG